MHHRARPSVRRPRASLLRRHGGVAVAILLLAACGGPPAAPASGADAPSSTAADGVPEVIAPPPQGRLDAVALDVGVALDADGRVAAVTDRIRPSDAVHASLVTVGESEAARVAVRWRDGTGVEIAKDERAVSAQGPAVHTFSRQPDGGWPPGRYEVEVQVDGESAGVRSFEVR